MILVPPKREMRSRAIPFGRGLHQQPVCLHSTWLIDGELAAHSLSFDDVCRLERYPPTPDAGRGPEPRQPLANPTACLCAQKVCWTRVRGPRWTWPSTAIESRSTAILPQFLCREYRRGCCPRGLRLKFPGKQPTRQSPQFAPVLRPANLIQVPPQQSWINSVVVVDGRVRTQPVVPRLLVSSPRPRHTFKRTLVP